MKWRLKWILPVLFVPTIFLFQNTTLPPERRPGLAVDILPISAAPIFPRQSILMSYRFGHMPAATNEQAYRDFAQFLATDLVWHYVNKKEVIDGFAKLGARTKQCALPVQISDNNPDPYICRELDGRPTRFTWQPASKNIVGNVVSPEFHEFKVNHAIHLVKHYGCNMLQQDDPEGILGSFIWAGGCFSESMDDLFAGYLKKFVPPHELEAAGVPHTEGFRYSDHLRALGAPSGPEFYKWHHPRSLLAHYKNFIKLQIINNLIDLRTRVRAATGQPNLKLTSNVLLRPDWPEKNGLLMMNVVDGVMQEADYDHTWSNIHGFQTMARDYMNPVMRYTGGGVFTARTERDDINLRLLATFHALGHSFIMPYDVWMDMNKPRMFRPPHLYTSTNSLIREPNLKMDGLRPVDFSGRMSGVDVTSEIALPARDQRPIVNSIYRWNCPANAWVGCDAGSYNHLSGNFALKITGTDPMISVGSKIRAEGQVFTTSSNSTQGAFYLKDNRVSEIARGSRVDEFAYLQPDGSFRTVKYPSPFLNGTLVRMPAASSVNRSPLAVRYIMRSPYRVVKVEDVGGKSKLTLDSAASRLPLANGFEVLINGRLATVENYVAAALTLVVDLKGVKAGDEIKARRTPWEIDNYLLPQGEVWPKIAASTYDAARDLTTIQFQGRLPFREFRPQHVFTFSSQARISPSGHTVAGLLYLRGDHRQTFPVGLYLFSIETPAPESLSVDNYFISMSGHSIAPGQEKLIHLVSWRGHLHSNLGVEVNALGAFGVYPRHFVLYQGHEEPMVIGHKILANGWVSLEAPVRLYGILKPIF